MKNLILAACILFFTLLLAGRLLPVDGKGFLYFELIGLHRALSFSDYCDDSLLAGGHGPLDRVHSDYSSSLLFLIPNKLLRGQVDTRVIDRSVLIFFYATFLTFIVLIGRSLHFPFLLQLVSLSYFALSERVITPFLMLGLAGPTYAWIALVLFCLFHLHQTQKVGKIEYFLIFLLPALLFWSYEFYCLVRPLAIILTVLLPVYFYFGGVPAIARKDRYPFLTLGYVFGYVTFAFIHPDVPFDSSLLRARYETVLSARNPQIWQTALERIQELRFLFAWNNYKALHHYFPVSSSVRWGEVLLAILLLGVPLGVMSLRGKGKVKVLWKTYAIPLYWLLFIGFLALITPLASTQPVRGHRLLGFLVSTTFIALIFAALLLKTLPEKGCRILKGLMAATIVVLLGTKGMALANWEADLPSDQFIATIDALKKIDTSNGIKPRTILICDRAELAHRNHQLYWNWNVLGERFMWMAMLSLSGKSCALGLKNIQIDSRRQYCSCKEPFYSEGRIFPACLERNGKSGFVQLELSLATK